MSLNLLKIVFTINTVFITLLGILLKLVEPSLPVEIRNLFRYGRYADQGKSRTAALQVPKRWFKHFYKFAAPLTTCVLLSALSMYLGFSNIPIYVYEILDFLMGTDRKPLVSPESTTLALILLTIQCWKRFYESHYVCIFSNAKMNIGHYALGYIHYAGTAACIIGEAKGFVKGSVPDPNWNGLTVVDYSCAVIFLLASYFQLHSNIILANLRKNKKGEVVTLQHKVPKGGLFDYISSPLQLTEILIYTMLAVILWNNETYRYVFVWVFSNQLATGLFGHWWYVETFKNYPKQRKAFIPWIL